MDSYQLKWPKIILFGDSLTQHSFEPENGLWGALLADRLQRICDVIPRGFSGYNTRMCKILLPRIFNKENIQGVILFIICLGANDCCDAESPTQQHVPLEEYVQNLYQMIEYLKSIGLSKHQILLITPPPYHHETYQEYCISVGRSIPIRSNEMVEKYAAECYSLGISSGLDVVHLFREMSKDQNWSRFLIDGLHFSHTGAVFVYTQIWPHVARRTEKLKIIGPIWTEFDKNDPEATLLQSQPALENN